MAKMKKILVLVLSVILCGMSIIPALAEETVTSTVEGVNEAGQTVITTTEETTTEGEDGKVIVEVTVHENITSEEGDYERNETTTTTTVTDENGNVVDTREVVEGSEVTITDKEEDDGNEAGQPEVTVQLKPGETTSNVGASESVTTGDPQKNEEDTVYNSTTVEEVERTVEATTEGGDIKVETTGQGDFNPIQTDREMINVEENQLHTHYKTSYRQTAQINGNTMNTKPEEGGYDFLFVGQGQMSDFYVGLEGPNEEGETEIYHSGALQFELVQDPEIVNNKITNDSEKDRFTTYCCDVTTDAAAGYWYKMDNLEDAGYYDEESAAQIRSIVSSGYWGTNAGEDAENPATGSIEKVKADMKAALASGAIEKELEYTYEAVVGPAPENYETKDGEYVYNGIIYKTETARIEITEEMIDAITPGQALAATQAAIWSHANDETEGGKVDYDRLIITGYKAPTVPTAADTAGAKAVFNYLMGLEPTAKEESTEIIDKDSFIKEDSMSITVGDKVADHENNEDENEDNDVYDVSINFALVVTPSENDDLIVQVVGIDAEGNASVVAKGRIAGNSEGDEGFNEVAVGENGEYSLKGLNLAENSGFTFDLKLSGTQYLEEGVYLFNSEVRNGVSSQTFVGIAEGNKEVNVSQSFVIEFDVDEDNYTRTTKRWGSDTAAKKPGSGNGNGNGSNNPPRVTLSFTPAAAVAADGTVEILDEEVPLAAAPETGDNSIIYVLVSLISLAGAAVLVLKRRTA